LLHANDRWANFIFGDYFPMLKIWTGQQLLAEAKAAAPEGQFDRLAVLDEIGKIVNDGFGGQEWARYPWATPKARQWLGWMLFAPNWCSIETCRAMTKNGFKYHDELSIGDEILTYDPDTKTTSWSPMVDKFYRADYNGDMIYIPNYNKEIGITPEHTCRVFDKKEEKTVKAFELKKSDSIPRCADYENLPTKKTINDRFVALAGWLVTDGHVKRKLHTLASGEIKEYRYGRITQSKPATVRKLKDLGLSFYVEKEAHTNFNSNYDKHVFAIPISDFNALESFGVIDTLSWEFISKLTKQQLELLEETMMLGNGTGQNRFCGGEEKDIFGMTLIRTLLGKPCTFYEQKQEGAHCWRTRDISSKTISCRRKETRHYEGGIWCPSVKTGFWVAEQDGMMFITGNTLSSANAAGLGSLPFVGNMIKSAPSEMQRDFMIKKYWPAMAGIVLVGIPNIIQSAIYGATRLVGGGDPDDVPFTFMNESGKKTYIDITPFMRTLPYYTGGESGKRRTYARFGKQAYEVFGEHGWISEPFKTLMRKTSQPVKLAFEMAFERSPGATWDLEFADMGWDGILNSKTGVMNSRVGYVARKFIPMSVQGLIDNPESAPFSFIVPTSKGISKGRATRQVADLISAYADRDTIQKGNSKRQNFERLHNLTADTLYAAELNGFDPKLVLKDATGLALGDMYYQLYTAIDKQKWDKADRIARQITRIGGNVKGALNSMKRRHAMTNRKFEVDDRTHLRNSFLKARNPRGL